MLSDLAIEGLTEAEIRLLKKRLEVIQLVCDNAGLEGFYCAIEDWKCNQYVRILMENGVKVDRIEKVTQRKDDGIYWLVTGNLKIQMRTDKRKK